MNQLKINYGLRFSLTKILNQTRLWQTCGMLTDICKDFCPVGNDSHQMDLRGNEVLVSKQPCPAA